MSVKYLAGATDRKPRHNTCRAAGRKACTLWNPHKETFGSTKAPTLSNQVGTWLLLENATKPRRPSEYKDYPTCHRLQVISATRICATHTHLQMEVPKLLLRISAIEGQVPGSTDLPLQKLPYAVLSLIRSRPFPCNHSPPRCRPWTTLHPHPVHRVHLPPPP